MAAGCRPPLPLVGIAALVLLGLMAGCSKPPAGPARKTAVPVGIVIDFALEAQRTAGKSPAEAAYQGSLIRFRPIMMTTFAALMGTLPVALGAGGGAESRRSLGLAVVGGLLVSQLLTLYLTPVMYIYMDQWKHGLAQWFRRRRRPDLTRLTPVE